MEGIIDMGEGDHTNPWDILKAGIGGFGAGIKDQEKTGLAGSAGSALPSATGYARTNPYADPVKREQAIQHAIASGTRSGNRAGEPFAQDIHTAQISRSRPVFKTPFMNDFFDAVIPHANFIASNPYKDNPFYQNNPIVDNWYNTITPGNTIKTINKTGTMPGREALGLDGQIATEPYTRRAYKVSGQKTAPSAIQSETEIDAAAYLPLKETVQKLRPFQAFEPLFDPERLKQTENTIRNLLNSGTSRQTNASGDQTIIPNNGENHGNPVTRTHSDENASGSTARTQTPATAPQNTLPHIPGETEQAAETGKDLYEGLKTIVPDAAVGAIVAGGKTLRDAARLTALVTGTDTPNQLADHIEKQTGQFIKTSGSDTLNRQRDAINQTLSDKNTDGADLTHTLLQNPYGALFGTGTELAGIAIPGGATKLAQMGIKWGSKLAPKAIEYGAKLLPWVSPCRPDGTRRRGKPATEPERRPCNPNPQSSGNRCHHRSGQPCRWRRYRRRNR